jgi:redox-sensitive bicupin YhaK (pirin superfamily)
MGFGVLRVINEDRVAPARGFSTHGHRDMEILTYVLAGALAHRDNLGNASTIRPGDVQRMSAGSGIMHSEVNPSPHEPVHLLQIWLLPHTQGLPPSYEERHFDAASKQGRLALLASSDGREGSVSWHTDATLYAGLFDGDAPFVWDMPVGRRVFVHLARGCLTVQGQRLQAGDAMALTDGVTLVLSEGEQAEVLVFDAGPL